MDPEKRPEVVCLCGSMRFVQELRVTQRDLTIAGAIVLAPVEVDVPPSEHQRRALGALHLRRIDIADRVVVVNPGGYLGASTSREIEYASAAGKPITYTHGSP